MTKPSRKSTHLSPQYTLRGEEIEAQPEPPPVAQTMPHIEIRRAPVKFAVPVAIVHRDALLERADWKDPADTGAAARMRGARTISGWRRVWVIQALHTGSPREITPAHVKAAERLLGDYEIGIEGASQGGAKIDRVDGTNNDGLNPWSGRLKAAKNYREAMEALGSAAALIVSCVVIDNWTIVRLAASIGVDRNRAFGRLAAGLERLREHYAPPRQNAATRAISEAPEPPIDAAVVDVPQERLGRWRARKAGRENPTCVTETSAL